MNIEFITGGVELLKYVKPLWDELKCYHKEVSHKFSKHLELLRFEDRKEKFIKSNKIKIDLIKDENNNQYIGYCVTSINKENTGEIESLYISEEYRKYGLGDKLMKRSLNWLDNNKVVTKTIVVAEGNEEVLGFYEKYGFYKKRIVLEQL